MHFENLVHNISSALMGKGPRSCREIDLDCREWEADRPVRGDVLPKKRTTPCTRYEAFTCSNYKLTKWHLPCQLRYPMGEYSQMHRKILSDWPLTLI